MGRFSIRPSSLRSFCLILSCLAVLFFSMALHAEAPAKETDTAREACIRSCNHDFDVCLDGNPEHYDNYGDSGFGSSHSEFGASADCKKALKSCLAACRGR